MLGKRLLLIPAMLGVLLTVALLPDGMTHAQQTAQQSGQWTKVVLRGTVTEIETNDRSTMVLTVERAAATTAERTVRVVARGQALPPSRGGPQITVGARVVIIAARPPQPDEPYQALRVEVVGAGGGDGPPPSVRALRGCGVIAALPSDGLHGVWTVRVPHVGSYELHVGAETQITPDGVMPELGDELCFRAHSHNTGWQATVMALEREAPADPTATRPRPTPTSEPDPGDPTAEPTDPAEPTAEPTEPADPTAEPTDPGEPGDPTPEPTAADPAPEPTVSPYPGPERTIELRGTVARPLPSNPSGRWALVVRVGPNPEDVRYVTVTPDTVIDGELAIDARVVVDGVRREEGVGVRVIARQITVLDGGDGPIGPTPGDVQRVSGVVAVVEPVERGELWFLEPAEGDEVVLHVTDRTRLKGLDPGDDPTGMAIGAMVVPDPADDELWLALVIEAAGG